MTRPDFIRKMNDMLDAAQRSKTFGSIEIELRAGEVVLIRKTETERIEDGKGIPHADRTYR